MKIQLALAVLAFGSSTAFADAHAEKKKAPDAKAPDAAKMEMPKPDAQIAEVAKAINGTWKCTGKGMGVDGKETDTKVTIANKVANNLDKWWIQTDITTAMGKTPYKIMSFTTYNPLEKKWMRVSVDNFGGTETTTSAGPKDGVLTWEGESIGQMAAPGGSHRAKGKHTEDMKDPKNVKMKGEYQMGGKWMTVYDVSCKK
jgi:hypothetical protein